MWSKQGWHVWIRFFCISALSGVLQGSTGKAYEEFPIGHNQYHHHCDLLTIDSIDIRTCIFLSQLTSWQAIVSSVRVTAMLVTPATMFQARKAWKRRLKLLSIIEWFWYGQSGWFGCCILAALVSIANSLLTSLLSNCVRGSSSFLVAHHSQVSPEFASLFFENLLSTRVQHVVAVTVPQDTFCSVGCASPSRTVCLTNSPVLGGCVWKEGGTRRSWYHTKISSLPRNLIWEVVLITTSSKRKIHASSWWELSIHTQYSCSLHWKGICCSWHCLLLSLSLSLSQMVGVK